MLVAPPTQPPSGLHSAGCAMNQRPLAHTSIPNRATGDKLPNPPIPSRFYYTPWACKEQLGREKGGWKKTARSGCKLKKKGLIDRNTKTVGRYTGQTKAEISSRDFHFQKDMCVTSDVRKKGALKTLSSVFLDKYVWHNQFWERSADRCQLLQVNHFRHDANVLRMGRWESLFLM